MLFDTHAHLNDPAFDEDRKEMILGLKDKGVDFVMNVGCCLESSGDCIKLAEEYPQYGFARNKGYGTAQHIAALREYGPCPAHRRSFIGNFVGK